ncbi:hypothetical protein ACFY84_32770 [Streptomyces sp. NPDC012438]|uniref:hypothetical protein n=1 Tax=Streptomyces sp. NPDC012438 TaxID=3364833 RepID=UPI0036E31732
MATDTTIGSSRSFGSAVEEPLDDAVLAQVCSDVPGEEDDAEVGEVDTVAP